MVLTSFPHCASGGTAGRHQGQVLNSSESSRAFAVADTTIRRYLETLEARFVARGFEFKRTTAPGITSSMRTALSDLRLTQLNVVHAGTGSFDLGRKIRAIAASDLRAELA